jgi:transcriptional regulator with XRE-family HTH domain
MSDLPHPVDIRVGQRVRERRKVLGITQDRLAQALDLTFQQVQKYERGVNRMSASKLFEAAQVLDVPVNWFFEGEALADSRNAEPVSKRDGGQLSTRETRDLLNAFLKLDPKLRRQVLELVKGMALAKSA